jgi:DegV family protein with EDD domain
VQLDAQNTAIVLDSTADFTEGAERFPNWRVVPLYVRFGDESFRDYVDLSPAEFYTRLKAAPTLPATSQPTPADFHAVYEQVARYERVYSLHLSSTFSGTVESARAAATEAGGGRVRVVDTGSVSSATALLALCVQQRLERGTTDAEIDELVERFRTDSRILFTVETLEYLARGGRIGRGAAFAGQLLNVKPVLAIREGEVVPVKRVRGSRRALAEIVELFAGETEDRPELLLAVAHADAPERAAELERLARERRPAASVQIVTALGAVVGTHAGPGTVGFFWFADPGRTSIRTGT